MTVKIAAFSLSLDGYGAGPGQDADNPLGERGLELHAWMRSADLVEDAAAASVDLHYIERARSNIGAWIMGRNMFGPHRGPWDGEAWNGWWGDAPPFNTPVFILTSHPRASVEMAGGTTFHFVTDGLEAALVRAKAAASQQDVRIGGGIRTIREALNAGWIDEIHLVIVPIVLGRGEAFFTGLDLPKLGFEVVEHVSTPGATHIILSRGNSRPDCP